MKTSLLKYGLTLGLIFFPTAQTIAQTVSAACNPQVQSALLEASRTGAERATGIINNPESGIGLPKSVFELGCLDNLFDLKSINVLFDPGSVIDGIINQAKQRICNTAKDYYTNTVSKPFNEAVFDLKIPSLPGLQTSYPTTSVSELPSIEIVPPNGSGSGSSSGTGTLDSIFKDFF